MKKEIKEKSIVFGIGSKIPTSNSEKGDYIEVMAIAQDYIMARRKGCMPFVKSLTEFGKFIDQNCIKNSL